MAGIHCCDINAQCKFEDGKVVVVSHRGDWRNAPENSLAAIRNCIDMGVNMVEIDLKKTKDNHLILLHDDTLDRTTNGTGKPSEYTLEEIKKLRLKNGLGRPTLNQVPTLEEAMAVAKGHIWVNIDKGYEYFDDVERILLETGTEKQVLIKSEQPYSIVEREHPSILSDLFYMPIVNANDPDALSFTADYIKAVHPTAFEVTFNKLTPQVNEVIDLIRKANCKVWINTLWPSLCAGLDDDRAVLLNERAQTWGAVINMGASFIQTDRPQELIEYLKQDSLFIEQEHAATIRRRIIGKAQGYVNVVSHRGDWKNYPENSIGAFQSAIRMGVDVLETDVQRTKDGVLVIMHDESVNRTTMGRGIIADMTYSELHDLRLKDSNGKPTDYRIPTLEEALNICKGKIIVNLDKGERFFDEVMAIVARCGMTDHVLMKGDFSLQELTTKYGRYLDRLMYMPKFRLDEKGAFAELLGFVRGMKPVAFEVGYKTDANKLPIEVKTAVKGTSLLWYNSLAGRNGGHDDVLSKENPDKGYGYLIDVLGARFIQTDEPQYLISYLRKRNLHD